MEKPFKIMISIFAVVLYSMAAFGFSDGTDYNKEVGQNVESTGLGVFIAEELPFSGGFAIKEGANFVTAGSISQTTLKQHQVQKAVIHALDVEITCAFSQNISQLHINPVRIRKSDMLFPFHYFFEPIQA